MLRSGPGRHPRPSCRSRRRSRRAALPAPRSSRGGRPRRWAGPAARADRLPRVRPPSSASAVPGEPVDAELCARRSGRRSRCFRRPCSMRWATAAALPSPILDVDTCQAGVVDGMADDHHALAAIVQGGDHRFALRDCVTMTPSTKRCAICGVSDVGATVGAVGGKHREDEVVLGAALLDSADEGRVVRVAEQLVDLGEHHEPDQPAALRDRALGLPGSAGTRSRRSPLRHAPGPRAGRPVGRSTPAKRSTADTPARIPICSSVRCRAPPPPCRVVHVSCPVAEDESDVAPAARVAPRTPSRRAC